MKAGQLAIKQKQKYFLEIYRLTEKKYGNNPKRLAGDDWEKGWQTLIATILSAQTRDETTIPAAEGLFKRYATLENLSNAKYEEVLKIISRVNFKYTKAKNVIAAGRYLVDNCDGRVPDDIDELIKIPGVGRKTANLIITMVHNKEGLTVDTHVHAICNLLGFVNTKNPTQTEIELKKIAPKKYWSRINRLFVLWGKQVPRKNKEKLLAELMRK
jgi:endonuclease-3